MRRHVGNGDARRQFIEIRCSDIVVDLGQHKLGKTREIHCEASGGLTDTLQHLVKLHRFAFAGSLNNVHLFVVHRTAVVV